MLLAVSGRLGAVEPVVGGRAACPKPLAAAGPVDGHPLRPRTTNRDNVAPCRRCQPRLPRLLLLPGGTRTQDQIGGHPVVAVAAADVAASRSAVGGHRRHADQTIRSKSRRGRHPSQPYAGAGRPEIPLRAYLGDALVGGATSLFWRSGPAVACHALRPTEDDIQNSRLAGLDVCHQTCTGGPAGRMDRSDRQKGRKNAVDRGRWRLRESAFFETRLAGRSHGDWTVAEGRGAVATCRHNRDAASGADGAVRPSTASTKSAWPSAPLIHKAGRRPNAPSTAKRW